MCLSPVQTKNLHTQRSSLLTTSQSNLVQQSREISPNFLKQFKPVPVRSGQENRTQDVIGNVPEPSRQQLYSQKYEERSSTSRSAVYKSYTLGKKLEVLAYVKTNSETKAAEHFKIPRTTILSWRGLDLVPNSQAKRRKGIHLAKGSGRRLSYPKEVDEDILCWILQRRDLQMPVQRESICQYAKSVVLPHNPLFTASAGWLQKFMIRHSLSLRRATSIQQKLPQQLQRKLETFLQEITAIRKLHQFNADSILNMDETPIWFDMPRNYTVTKTGERQVRIRGTGSDKKRISVVLTATASGKMLKPLIIFKGKTNRTLKNVQIPSTVVCTYQKKGYMDTTTMMLWIKKILNKYTMGQHCLLVFDTFSAHITEDVLQSLRKSNIQTAVIPRGCTSKVQPLDVSLNKPFKTMVKKQWEMYMQDNSSTAITADPI